MEVRLIADKSVFSSSLSLCLTDLWQRLMEGRDELRAAPVQWKKRKNRNMHTKKKGNRIIWLDLTHDQHFGIYILRYTIIYYILYCCTQKNYLLTLLFIIVFFSDCSMLEWTYLQMTLSGGTKKNRPFSRQTFLLDIVEKAQVLVILFTMALLYSL